MKSLSFNVKMIFFEGVMKKPLFVSVENLVETTASKYQILVDSLPCKVFLSSSKLAKIVEIFFNYLFSHVKGFERLTCSSEFRVIKEFSGALFSRTLRISLNIKTSVSFISLKGLHSKLIKHIQKSILIYKKGGGQLTTSVLKIISTVSAIFNAPETISKFFEIFGLSLSSSLADKVFIPNVISLVFAPSKIISKIRACRATADLLAELKREKRKAFLTHLKYKTPEELDALLPNELKRVVKSQRITGKNFKKVHRAANIHFVKILNQKITENPQILDKIFKIKFENKEIELGERNKSGKFEVVTNFFEKLNTKKVQRKSKKLSRAVKVIQSRLHHRVATNRYIIIAKSISFGVSAIGQLETFGIPCHSVSPFKMAIEGVLEILSFVNLFYQEKKQKEFISQMESLAL